MTVSNASCPCRVFPTWEEAIRFGPGGIWYRMDDTVESPQFPQDVISVGIVMPVKWSEASEDPSAVDPEYDEYVHIPWTTRHHPKNAINRHNWDLSGTYEAPTLSPSLHWVGIWHGFLTNGELKSC